MEKDTETLNGLMKDARICMITTVDENGKITSRPMTLQEAELDKQLHLWFFTMENSEKVQQIQRNSQVNVSFSDQKHSSWVSVSGSAQVVSDREKMKELWNPILKAWFPDGIDTPGLVLLSVRIDSAEYWDAPNSKVKQILGMAKSAITGEPYEPGENKTIDV